MWDTMAISQDPFLWPRWDGRNLRPMVTDLVRRNTGWLIEAVAKVHIWPKSSLQQSLVTEIAR